MTPLAGSVALNLALGFSIISIVSLSIYTSNNDERINLLGHRSALASSFLVFLSTFVLSYQLMISNFDIDYVARYTSFETPTMYIWRTEDTALGRQCAELTSSFVSGEYRYEVFEGVNHWITEIAAKQLNSVMLDFLSEKVKRVE